MTPNVLNFNPNILFKKSIILFKNNFQCDAPGTTYVSRLIVRNAVEKSSLIFTQQCCSINKYFHTCTNQINFLYYNNYKTPLFTSLFYIRALISRSKFTFHNFKFLQSTGYCIWLLYIITLVINKIYVIALIFH